jgi:flagella basal body P-ring formation protein FlgA
MRLVLSTLVSVLALACASGWCRAYEQPEAQARKPIVLVLRASATASDSQVRIGDIADLKECEEPEHGRIARLDLAELPLSSQPILISQQQIGFRLQLAGFASNSFRLEGPRFVRVGRPAGEGLDAKIAAVARQALEQKLSTQGDDYRIELPQAVSLPPLSAEGSDIHLEPELRSPVVPPCRVAVEVAIYVRGARRSGVIVYLDVKKLQSIPVAVRRIENGEAFSADNVHMERIAIESTQKATVSVAGLMGRKARRTVPAGRPIETEDVEGDAPAAVVIHVNELVHLIANVGPLQVKTRGEALQNGRVGQLIQVRNLESKNTVTGRVVDGSTVEVDY